MIVLADSQLTFALDIESTSQLERIANIVLDIAIDARREFFVPIDAEPHVWLEEGSLKVKTRILTAGANIILWLGAIDGALGGFERVRNLGTGAANYIAEHVVEVQELGGAKVTRRRVSAGAADKVHSLLEAVRTGALTPEEAQERIEKIFARPEDRLPRNSLIQIRSYMHGISPIGVTTVTPRVLRSTNDSPLLNTSTFDTEDCMAVRLPEAPSRSRLPKKHEKPSLRVEAWEAPNGKRRRRFY